MDQKALIRRVAILIVLIFIANTLAMKFYWYYSIWWFDMPMHFFGGFWLSWTAVWLLLKLKLKPGLIKVMIWVLMIGAGWEIFEILAHNVPLGEPINYLDIFSDICFDLAGGLAATFFLPMQNGTIDNNV
jgi:hypothetical protein